MSREGKVRSSCLGEQGIWAQLRQFGITLDEQRSIHLKQGMGDHAARDIINSLSLCVHAVRLCVRTLSKTRDIVLLAVFQSSVLWHNNNIRFKRVSSLKKIAVSKCWEINIKVKNGRLKIILELEIRMLPCKCLAPHYRALKNCSWGYIIL
ncbi:uncharacterized protein A4U43_C07F17940 [Asparagus officinalis]|uniref:Uncharacterized protein n=1 Tax=Asparagus officinalis TaxID=4686 RepID=A0A5P1ECT5_ASPOF|nr:uncharacterized protein A4U43_C07F17940 [Asparagus officinalis]